MVIENQPQEFIVADFSAIIQACPHLEDYPAEQDSFSMESNRLGLIARRLCW